MSAPGPSFMSAGKTQENVAPGPTFQRGPQPPTVSSTMERLMRNPMPMPCAFVV